MAGNPAAFEYGRRVLGIATLTFMAAERCIASAGGRRRRLDRRRSSGRVRWEVLVPLGVLAGLLVWFSNRHHPDLQFPGGATVDAGGEESVSARSAFPGSRSVAPAAGLVKTLGVEVSDLEGRRVSDARIINSVDGGVIGHTNSEGRADASGLVSAGDTIVVTANGFVKQDRPVTATDIREGRIAVILLAAASLNGTVVLADGRPAGPGVTILAWDEALPVDDLARTVDPLSGGIRTCLSAADGTFVIEGVDPSRRFGLSAVGAGFLADDRSSYRDPGGGPVSITVHPHYLQAFRLVDAGHCPIPSNGYFGHGPSWSPMTTGLQSRAVAPLEAWALLAGGVPEGLGRGDTDTFLLSYLSDDEQGAVGPVRVRVRRPGYDELQSDVMVPRSRIGSTEVDLNLVPAKDELLASLAVDFAGWSSEQWEREASRMPAAIIKLADGFGATFSIPVWQAQSQRLVLDGVPVGSWQARLELHNSLASIAPEGGDSIDIEPGLNQMSFNVPDLGGVAIAVVDRAGSSVDGLIVVALESLSTHRSGFARLESAPHRLLRIPQGRYRVGLNFPRPAETDAVRPAEIDVPAGGMTRVTLVADI